MRASNGRSISEAPIGRFRRAVFLAASAQLAAALGTTPAPAWASDTAAPTPEATREAIRDATRERKAADLKARADAAMDGGAYAEAITSYRASYDLSRNPALLYNIGSAYERLGDYPRALAYLEQFSVVASTALTARVPALGELIASVRGRLARVVVGCNIPGARILVRGAWEGTTPLAASIPTLPGLARVEVVAEGYQPFVRDVVLTAGRETRLEASLVDRRVFASERRESAGPSDGGLATRWWFWTGLGVVVAGGATAAAVALATHHSQQPAAMQTSGALLRW
jgi:hypothetical protein